MNSNNFGSLRGVVVNVYDPTQDSIDNQYKYQVRIPRLHGIAGAKGGTPTNNLPWIPVCTLLPRYNSIANTSDELGLAVHDVVLVLFENNTMSRPIILGRLNGLTMGDING